MTINCLSTARCPRTLKTLNTPTKKLVWRRVANDALSDKPEKNQKKLEKAVGEIFDHFPPKSKG